VASCGDGASQPLSGGGRTPTVDGAGGGPAVDASGTGTGTGGAIPPGDDASTSADGQGNAPPLEAGSTDSAADISSGSALELSDAELVFSAFLGTTSVERTLTMRNRGSAPLDITLALRAPAAPFVLNANPALPRQIPAGAEVTAKLAFAPAATGMTGVYQGAVRITSSDPLRATVEIGLWGLATKAAQGENEPPLKQIVDTLGYAINVGGTNLSLGTGASPIGDEVRAQLFRRATVAAVTLRPVARYSPNEPIPYGIYTPAGTNPTLRQVGVIQLGQEQTLLPTVEPGALTQIDPGDMPFGVYTSSKVHKVYTEDALNTGTVKHAVRSYPLKDRAGKPVPNAYLVCFEEAANGDYQDYVFVLGNAVPAP